MKFLFNCALIALLSATAPLPARAELAPDPLEAVPASEAWATQQVVQGIASSLKPENGIVRRDAHAKHHGCVKATFEVLPGLPAAVRSGVFAQPGRHKAWIRYSNGSGHSQNDAVGDGRGMAIKLTDIPGDKLLDSEPKAQTQDFLMINHPVFFVRNAPDYVEFQNAAMSGNPLPFFFPGLNPLNWRTRESGIVAAITAKLVSQPLETRYWSMTPYRLGQQAAKFTAYPCEGPSGRYFWKLSKDFLRENMQDLLSKEKGCFIFAVQLRNDPGSQPIEDPTVEWSESRSAPIPVARIQIPQQYFSSPAQMDFCEDLSFTPWHSLPEHRPLGGINRVRRTVYEAISELRHSANHRKREEPTGDEVF